MLKKINKVGLIWLFILLCFLYYFLYLIYTKKYLLFVHPRMGKYIMFSAILLLLLVFNQIINLIKRYSNEKFKCGYIIFLIPLLCALLAPTQNISASISKNKNIGLSSQANTDQSPNQKARQIISQLNPYGTLTSKDIIKGDKINVDDVSMSFAMQDMYVHPKRYENKSITLKGFIYRDKNFNVNEFAVARLWMTCCTADTSIIGLTVKYNDAGSYKSNTWVTVNGTVRLMYPTNKSKNLIPYVQVAHISMTNIPKNQYVY